ncbi:MAG: response regulator [Myxococcales bacterium]|nr:response regulator [Myxococcales bacterium]
MEHDDPAQHAWQASPLAIVTLEGRGHVRSCNPACERMFGRSEGELRDRPLVGLAHPLDRGALRQMIAEALAGRVPGRQEIRFERPHCEPIVTGFSIAPTRSDEDGAVCVLRDLSAEKVYRPQLLHAERMASIGTVASVVAHELNNALAGALGCLQLLPRPTEPGAQELLDSLGSELRRAAEIVRELKGYARAEEGMSERIELPALVERLERLRRYQGATGSVVPLRVELDEGLPVLLGNANQLLQALLNLVRNAEQATAGLPQERRVIDLRVAKTGEVVLLEIIDRGPGVPAQLRSRLFEPFYSTKPTGEGTGLGLTVVQAVAAGHGGRVEVDDTPEGGATFRLVLPVPAQPSEGAAPRPRGTHAEHPRLRGSRILVADDEPIVRRIVERACSRQGSVVTCVDGVEPALRALREQDFELVVLDVRMPDGGGARVFRAIQDEHPHLVRRTLFMSGELSADMAQLAGQGYAGILQKPFELHELLDMLDGMLARTAPAKRA